MPVTHGELLQYMQQLDYAISENGMCFGFACMGMQAILAGELEIYNRRLNTLSKITPENLFHKIERVRDKVKKLGRDYNEKSLTDTERDILSIPAFFEGVALYFSPDNYPGLFEEKERPVTQNPELTFPRVLSKQLTIEEEIEEGKNKYKIEKINIEKIDSFSGIYNIQELEKYFEIMHKTFNEQKCDQPIGFILSSSTHTVTVGYDHKTQHWQWINASQSQTIREDKVIAEEIMNAFSENGITAFSTEVYVKKTKVAQIEEYLSIFKKNEDWKKLHCVTQEKSQKKDSKNVYWLYIAAQQGDCEVVKLLLDAKADPNQACENSATPLYIAAQNGHFKVVKLLLEAKADPNQARNDGVTPLYIAAQQGDFEVVKLLLDAKADPNQAENGDMTPLYAAAQEGHFEVVKLLLDAKADPNQAEKNGATPLYIATQNGHFEVVKLLLDAKADPNISIIGSTTVLLNYAKKKNCENSVRTLLTNNNTQPIPENLANFTPLHAAVFFGHTNLVQLLLDFDVKIPKDPNVIDLALAMNRTEIVKVFTEHLTKRIREEKDASVQKRFEHEMNTIKTKLEEYREKNRKKTPLEHLKLLYVQERKDNPIETIEFLFNFENDKKNIPVEVILGCMLKEKENLENSKKESLSFFKNSPISKIKQLDNIINQFKKYLMKEEKMTDIENLFSGEYLIKCYVLYIKQNNNVPAKKHTHQS